MCKIFILLLFIFGAILNVFCQEKTNLDGYKLIKSDPFSLHFAYLDTLTLDTFHWYRGNQERVLVSKEGVELTHGFVFGGMGTKCGCEPEPHGLWIKKYRNGHLKEVGEYECNKKIGTWTYFYDNSNVSLVETYKMPYSDISNVFRLDTLRNRLPLKSGLYAEYHLNGKRKTEGRYEIVEAFSPSDTVETVNPANYNIEKTIISGSFWHPKSIKVDIWKTFDEKGNVIKTEDYRFISSKNENYRLIINRYLELIEQLKKE